MTPYRDLTLSSSAQAVGACLADAQTRPACLEPFLNQSGLIQEVYWSYQDVQPSSSSPYVDACQVFVGPAENPQLTPSQQAVFQACIDQYPDSGARPRVPTGRRYAAATARTSLVRPDRVHARLGPRWGPSPTCPRRPAPPTRPP